MDFRMPIPWMNGTPRNCAGCGKFLPIKKGFVECWQNNATGKLYCSDLCEDVEPQKLLAKAEHLQ